MTASHFSLEQANWNPQSEADLASALQHGLLEETHRLEMKAAVPTGASANKELAKDLAQFAIDGGVILVGVAESVGSMALSPVQLSGLCERIEQIAQTRIEPPLFISCKEIPSVSDPKAGYVLVKVPPSPSAPHMVDGRYPARGDKSRRYLSDAEVTRYHQARQRTVDAADSLLNDCIARDPVPSDQRQSAHLFVVAVPTNPRSEMFLPLLNSERAQPDLMNLIRSAAPVAGIEESNLLPPTLASAYVLGQRADGIALTSGLTDDRSPQSNDLEDIIEIAFGEEGTLQVFNARLSFQANNGEQQILGPMLAQSVRQTLNVTSALAAKVGYGGTWSIGVAATGLAGLRVWRTHGFTRSTAYPTDRDEYRQTTSADSSELHQAAGAVTQRLVGRYLRTLRLANDSAVRSFLS